MSITNSLAGIAVTDLVFADAKRAGSGSVTLVVDDTDAQLRALAERNIVVGEETSSAKVETAIVHDPEGNQIVFEQDFDKAHLSSSS